MQVLIYICAGYSIFFALFHSGFWKMFKWKDDLKNLHTDNKAVMQTLNVHLIYYLLFVAFICIAFPAELMSTAMGNAFLLGSSAFWLLRIVNQFIFFKANKVSMAIILTVFFTIGAVLFALPVFL